MIEEHTLLKLGRITRKQWVLNNIGKSYSLFRINNKNLPEEVLYICIYLF